jgi:drug/metabolite transporter (DMT)-like permease
VKRHQALIGALFATITAVAWGGQFVVGKSALDSVNAFPLTTVRYAIAAGLWIVVLWLVEGGRALRTDGYFWRLYWLGSLGFAGFNLLAYTGLAHARPESASLIVALSPLITAIVLWQRTRVRPDNPTFGFMALALFGVMLVISGGHPTTIFSGSIGWGDALVLGGVISFVIYGLGAATFVGFSSLRYTTLTAALGWVTIAVATVIACASGLVPVPSAQELLDVAPQIAYLAIPGAFIAVLTWNSAIKLIGPRNAALFGNLIPVTTFAIEIVRGYRPNAIEISGAVLTIAALVANNLYARRSVTEGAGVAPEESDLGQGGEQARPIGQPHLRPLARVQTADSVAVDDHGRRDVDRTVGHGEFRATGND